jgi:TonB family protein
VLEPEPDQSPPVKAETPIIGDLPQDIPGTSGKGIWVPEIADTGIPTVWLKRMPRVLKAGHLEYPGDLKSARVEGEVTLLVLINEAGKLRVVKVLHSTNRGFIEPAIKAAEDSVFEPPVQDGKPVRSYYKLPFRFSLN